MTISNWGFPGNCDEVLPLVVDAKGGYTMVLAGLKAWLEHGIELNLVTSFRMDVPVDQYALQVAALQEFLYKKFQISDSQKLVA